MLADFDVHIFAHAYKFFEDWNQQKSKSTYDATNNSKVPYFLSTV